jgi:hypothetical protein
MHRSAMLRAMSEDASSSGDDRRAEARHLACYPFHIQKGDRGATGGMEIAIIHDLSPSGALLYSPGEIPIGTRVKLHLDFPDQPVRVVEGHVVRAERRSLTVADVWSFAVGVHFDESQSDLLPEMLALEKKLADDV